MRQRAEQGCGQKWSLVPPDPPGTPGMSRATEPIPPWGQEPAFEPHVSLSMVLACRVGEGPGHFSGERGAVSL